MDGLRSLAGQLLIAAPPLVDPNFFRTVVLVIEHEPDGAVGVVLNRPGEHEAETALPDLAPVLEEGERLHEGGPVQTEAVVALGEWRGDALPESPVVGAVGLLTGGLETTGAPRDRPARPGLRGLRGLGTGPARGGARRGGVDPRACAAGRRVRPRPAGPLAAGARAQGRRLPPAGADAGRPFAQLEPRAGAARQVAVGRVLGV